MEGLHGAGHMCGEECAKRAEEEWVLRWRALEVGEHSPGYGRALDEDREGCEAISAAIDSGDINLANARLKEYIFEAAKKAQMAKPWRCPLIQRPGASRPPWFDGACQRSKAALRAAMQRGGGGHAYQQLKQEHRRLVRRTQRRFDKHRMAKLLAMLRHRNPLAYKMLEKRKPKTATPIPVETWHNHMVEHFAPPPPMPPAAPVLPAQVRAYLQAITAFVQAYQAQQPHPLWTCRRRRQ